MQVKAVFYWHKPMRLQAHLTEENTVAITQLLDTVNDARKRAGLEPTTLTFLTNEIIARTVERSTVNLCSVFVSPGQPSVLLRQNVPVPVETLRWWRQLVDLNPQDLAPRIDALLPREAS